MNRSVKIILSIVLSLFLICLVYYVLTVKYSSSTQFSYNNREIPDAKEADRSNCIILLADGVELHTNGKQEKISYDEVRRFITPHLSEIKQTEFSIIINDNIEYKNVTAILDEMIIAGIKNYKLVKQ